MEKNTYIEAVQDITLAAIFCIEKEIDDGLADGREFLSECRRWAEEFEKEWAEAQAGDLPVDYMVMVEDFAEKKAKEYAKSLRSRNGQHRYKVAVTLPLTLWVEVWAEDEHDAQAKALEIAEKEPYENWGDDTMETEIVRED